jgi:hypothetical protein
MADTLFGELAVSSPPQLLTVKGFFAKSKQNNGSHEALLGGYQRIGNGDLRQKTHRSLEDKKLVGKQEYAMLILIALGAQLAWFSVQGSAAYIAQVCVCVYDDVCLWEYLCVCVMCICSEKVCSCRINYTTHTHTGIRGQNNL